MWYIGLIFSFCLIYVNNIFKEQQIVANGTKESLSANKVQSITKEFVGTESSLIMRCKNQPYEKQEKNITVLKNIVWPLSTIRKSNHSRYGFDYDNQLRTEINSRFRLSNNIRDQLKLRRSENKINMRKLHDGKFRKTGLEKLPLEMMKSFKQNFSGRTMPNDTVYLYENRTSKCVIN